MSQQERVAWDERFRTGDHASTEPDPFLKQLNEYSEDSAKTEHPEGTESPERTENPENSESTELFPAGRSAGIVGPIFFGEQMSQQERVAWDERFRTGDHASTEPDPFLKQLNEYSEDSAKTEDSGKTESSEKTENPENSESTELFPAGRRALDVACGAGRNAVWLAERGWDVTACDISLEGLRQAQELARQRGVGLQLFCQDLETVVLPPNRFDLMVCFFYLQRGLFPALKTALRPGGLIAYKTYTVDQLRFPGRPRHPTHLLQRQELLSIFQDFRVLCYQEIVKDRGVAQIIAQKPSSEPRP